MIYLIDGSIYGNFLITRGASSLVFFKAQRLNANLAMGDSCPRLKMKVIDQITEYRRFQISASELQTKRKALVQQRTVQNQLARYQQYSKNNSKAIASQFLYKADVAYNTHRAAIVHHWGAGGGGSHYNMANGKLFQKGFRLKGVVSRHSSQQARKTPQLRDGGANAVFGRTQGTSFKQKKGGKA
jgi:hypothetical protein